jgi:hypothetical protein
MNKSYELPHADEFDEYIDDIYMEEEVNKGVTV